jgi:hypothetical protein
MHSQGLRIYLENIFALTQALCDARGMERIHGVDGLEVNNQNEGNDSSGAADHTTSHDA